MTQNTEHESFWQKTLAGDPPAVTLPLDFPRPPVSSYLRAKISVFVGSDLLTQLATVSASRKQEKSTILFAAFQVLLTRYAKQNDFLLWYVGNSGDSECSSSSYLFPWRTSFESHFNGDDAIDYTAKLMTESLKHAATLSGSTLFASAGTFAPKLKVAFIDSESQKENAYDAEEFLSDCEVVFAVQCGNGQLCLSCEYDEEALRAETVSRMFGHWLRLLEGMLASPGAIVSALPMLTNAEFNHLVGEHTYSETEPVYQCLHELFEKQVVKSPDAIALTCGGSTLTYRELNRRGNCLARKLRDAGVGADDLVGLYLERKNDLIVAILAVLKSGGAYLPIDVSYPPERVAFMLADSCARILLTESSLQSNLQESCVAILNLDETFDDLNAIAHENLESIACPENLAYVIYTSGTTGQPKGTLITHRNVVRLFSSTDASFDFSDQDVWTLFHSCAFDFSVWEIWGALLYGGRLIVIPYSVSRTPATFYELLSAEKVTVLNQTPSSFRQLISVEESFGQKPLSLRYIILGGEVLELESLRPWFQRHGDQTPQLVNMYGITETTVHVTYRPLTDRDVGGGSVIGKPIPDLYIHILEPNGQPAPIGVPGEMYVGGSGVCHGYLGRDELTAERFIDDPFFGSKHRLYRTGDEARWRADGDIEYLGRIDHQVKIRGFRVELQEIESVLLSHPTVHQCVVLAREDKADDKRLVAYIILEDGSSNTMFSQLRDHLRTHLPDYMVPASFVAMEKFPLTNNGKIDLRALPAPNMERSSQITLEAPVTELEQRIAGYWRESLNIDAVDVHDNFFDLGGHSLMLAKVHSQLRHSDFPDLEILDLYSYPSIRSLVDFLLNQQKEAKLDVTQSRAKKQLAAIKRRGDRRPARPGGPQ